MSALVMNDKVLLGLGEYAANNNSLQLANDLWEFIP
jgi:hypothetical protein